MSPSRQSARSRLRVDQCFSEVRAMEVPLLVCLCSSCSHVTEEGGRRVCEISSVCCHAKLQGLSGCNLGITKHGFEWSARPPTRKFTVQICARETGYPYCGFSLSPPGSAKAQLQIRRPAYLDIVLNYIKLYKKNERDAAWQYVYL